MQTRSQQYSQIVFGQINGLNFDEDTKKNEKLKKRYGSLCHNFPLMILRNGLSQAVAFVLVKAKLTEKKEKQSLPHKVYLEHLTDLTGIKLDEGEKSRQFQQKISSLDLMDYQHITRKILAASIWYKRFAESLLGVEPGVQLDEQLEEMEDTDNGN